MEIQQKDNEENGLFYIKKDNQKIAEMTYFWAESNSIIINHTEVNEQYKGMGLGKQLVAKAVDFARKNNITILPLCPFAKIIFDKVPEFRDVLIK